MFFDGKGIKQNYKEAFNWWIKAADSGNADAQHNLGYMYENGFSVEKNIDQAVSWYKKGANKDDKCKQALKRLGY